MTDPLRDPVACLTCGYHWSHTRYGLSPWRCPRCGSRRIVLVKGKVAP